MIRFPSAFGIGLLAASAVWSAAAAPDPQDFRNLIPAEIHAGSIVIQGKIIHRAVDGSWLRLKLRSEVGEFSYRVTPLGKAMPAIKPDETARIVLPAGTERASTLEWSKIGPEITVANDLWWEGQITRVSNAGSEIEGSFVFADGVRNLRLRLGENVPAGLEPEPTFRDVAYGGDERQRLDVYLAPQAGPRPVAVYIHGGGWTSGDKNTLRGQHAFLAAGISVVAINYRYCPKENPAPDTPAVAWPLRDAARAIQYIRSRAGEWNLDSTRMGAWGGSAGGCSSLWLGTHPDMAQKNSADPVARQSTRLSCAAGIYPQTTLDPVEMRGWAGDRLTYGPHAFGLRGVADRSAFEVFLALRDDLRDWIAEYSPAELLTEDDPPMFLDYVDFTLTPTNPANSYYTHSPGFGVGYFQRAKALGVECHLRFVGLEDEAYAGWQQFLIAKLLSPSRS